MEIKNICVHHSGGVGTDRFASTNYLTAEKISIYHKSKWNFPSNYIINEDVKYAGYNAIYDPKTMKFTQCRAIGEETAAQRGHNFDTFSLCIIGNYNRKLIGKGSVDYMEENMEKDIAAYLLDLINGNKRNLVVVPWVDVNLSITRVYPHRFLRPGTDCYGTSLSSKWIGGLLAKWKLDGNDILKKRIKVLEEIIKIYLSFIKLLIRKNTFGANDDRECSS